ncbi:MAG: hypothetical protein KBS74_04615 [Clostridiales bacterium]|nr:hypothetical protein [Candidatus Cacconaster stercorequi]
MKKLISLLLVFCMMLSLAACGAPAGNDATDEENAPADSQTTGNEEDAVDDAAWDELESLGNIKTENGVLTVTITVPADFAGEDVTQAKLDEEAGEKFISAKLNDDGSVTYKMTKKQHKAMLDNMVEGMDEALQEMIDSDDYAITGIKHNKDYTQFDVTLSTEDVGLAESFMVIAFYMYGGVYGIFSGHEAADVTVNYYNANGDLLQSANSADMAE